MNKQAQVYYTTVNAKTAARVNLNSNILSDHIFITEILYCYHLLNFDRFFFQREGYSKFNKIYEFNFNILNSVS